MGQTVGNTIALTMHFLKCINLDRMKQMYSNNKSTTGAAETPIFSAFKQTAEFQQKESALSKTSRGKNAAGKLMQVLSKQDEATVVCHAS